MCVDSVSIISDLSDLDRWYSEFVSGIDTDDKLLFKLRVKYNIKCGDTKLYIKNSNEYKVRVCFLYYRIRNTLKYLLKQ